MAFWKNNKPVNDAPGELQFDDDPRLTPEHRASSLREGNLIEKDSGIAGRPLYFYIIKMKS